MSLQETTHQITLEQINKRDIGQQYVRIRENTEFLTHVIRYQPARVHKYFTNDVQNVQIRSFYNIVVQSSYLLYTCFVKKVVLYLGKRFIVEVEKDGTVQVKLEFFLEKQLERFNPKRRQQIGNYFTEINTFKYQNAYAHHVLQIMKDCLRFIKQSSKKQKDKCLESLQNVYGSLSACCSKQIKPKIFISCLEQTQLFRNYSYLLKTLNCSLYENIRKTDHFNQILSQIKSRQIQFCENYNNVLRQGIPQHQFLQSSIEDFINFMIEKKVLQSDISLKSKLITADNMKEKTQTKIGGFQFLKQGSISQKVYIWKIIVQEKKAKQSVEKNIMGQTQGESTTVISSQKEQNQKIQNLLQIQLIASRKIFNVLFISNIEVNIENSDALTFHCNNMMLDLQNLIVQNVDRQSLRTKKKQKVLAFKICSHLTPKDSPFINLMLAIDRALIYGKVCEPDLFRKITRIEDYQPFVVLSQRINHISNFFLKKVRRLYQSASINPKY